MMDSDLTNGKELVWDFTVVDKLTKPYVCELSEKIGAAAQDAEERKIMKYQENRLAATFRSVGVCHMRILRTSCD
ncbi:hypothetical protein RvY_02894 [Ramazzottius varieornatus]|uniref:Uncharacterized protein n=1 Tax=Ramazzottius varieornatus TaxID=947166 RepID=A0A1D1UTA7_RAMVA|nr:hypothetical protein RvY_02894 [Ramazzottius varieornatus]